MMLCIISLASFLTLGCEKQFEIYPPQNPDPIPIDNNSWDNNNWNDNEESDNTSDNNNEENEGEENDTSNVSPTIPISPPPDAAWPYEHIHRLTPPEGFTAIIPWAQAVHDIRQGYGESMVEVDYLKLWAVVNGTNQLICEDTYNAYDQGSVWFGLYSRNPWFGTDDHQQMPVTYTSEGWLRFFPNTHPDKVWHWWDTQNPKPYVPTGTQRVWVEMKVKITGPALVQIGADFYRTPTAQANQQNVAEMGVSNWYGNGSDWQIIILGIPGN